ncbi:MAG: ATP-dependent helicase HrpB [Deltaproteobacteria bacterium]|nr:ATP-dependent helicase HrpB [Deltaproteobacteria bacterium]
MIINTNLPIEEVLSAIRKVFENGRNAVLEAPPGAGKTTLVPLALINEPWLKGRRIVMLEPRRLAARAAAMRMAELLGEEVGDTVGYRTRLDSRVGPSTRIEVVTEGILTRFLQSDPSLEGAGLVIFDEFHERSIHADLGLALCLESQTVLREDLRVLIMSATLDGQEVARLLGNAPVVKSEGKAFPVETRYLPESRLSARQDDYLTGSTFISTVSNSIIKAVGDENGSILVFLPGGSEIRRVESKLKEGNLPPNIDVVPLYGDLPRELQDKAIRPSLPGIRKVVLATSIAETSLTIEGVRVIIDGGLMRVSRFSPATGMSRLETVRVTRASADQRRGRAGRIEPGICIRLWTGGEDRTLREQNTPEIMEADLTPLALELSTWGTKDAGDLRWIDPPPSGALSHARELLVHLGAIDEALNLTPHGREMARMGVHPRLAHMVIKGKELDIGNLACELAALLTERDILKTQPGKGDSDLRFRIELLHRKGADTHVDRAALERVKKAAEQIKRQIKTIPFPPPSTLSPSPQPSPARGEGANIEDVDRTGLLLAFAYPDRIAKRRPGGDGRYLLANGRGALFPRPEPLSSEEYLVAASLEGGERESRIYLAAPVGEAELIKYFADEIDESEFVSWDSGQQAVAARKQRKLWNLIISDVFIQNPDEEKVLKAFLSGIRQAGLRVLPWDKVSENIRARVNFLHRIGKDLPELSDEWLLNNLDEWLAPWLKGMTRLEHLKRLDLNTVILGMLPWEKQKTLEKLAPTHITVPSGSRIPIDYLSGERPFLAVRLQEMFGLEKTPAIADGKVPLVLHLLSPAGRPVQVTEDLTSFWAGSYHLVKKDLKGRYPKHYWPDDPLQAEPTSRAKARR